MCLGARKLSSLHVESRGLQNEVQRDHAAESVLQQTVGVALRQDHHQPVETLQQRDELRRPRVEELQPHVDEHGRLQHLHELIRLQEHRQ